MIKQNVGDGLAHPGKHFQNFNFQILVTFEIAQKTFSSFRKSNGQGEPCPYKF